MEQDNNNLRASVEEKAADLYHKMRQRLAHSGNDFTEVGKKQQYRHLTQIQLVNFNQVFTKGTPSYKL